jgi:hypothetical protein
MSTHVHPVPATPTSRTTLVVAVAVAVVTAIVVNTGIAIGVTSLAPDGTRTGLALVAYGSATAFGVLAGTAGWAAVRRYASRPRAALRVLVPGVLALSFVPGVILFTNGQGVVNVVGLWVMHLVVAIVTVTMASRFLPLADKNT